MKKLAQTSKAPGFFPSGDPSPSVPDGKWQDRLFLPRIKTWVKERFDAASGSHDWDHTLRVSALCERIGPAEGADMDILQTAALLHDIGRCRQDQSRGAVCHAEIGARLAADMLSGSSIPIADRDNIIHCVATHRFRGDAVPATIEAKVLFDADKMDAIGAVGIARAYLFAGEIGARLHNRETDIAATKAYSREDTGFREYCVKLSKIKDRIITDTGKAMAEKRHAFMEQFFDRFLKEYHGKDD